MACTCFPPGWSGPPVRFHDHSCPELLAGVARPAPSVRQALVNLVVLKDGPRDTAYYAAKDRAWDDARIALAAPVPPPLDGAQIVCLAQVLDFMDRQAGVEPWLRSAIDHLWPLATIRHGAPVDPANPQPPVEDEVDGPSGGSIGPPYIDRSRR